MTRAELKSRARQQLGGGIFQNNWMWAVLICLILAGVTAAAGTIIPGVGGFVVLGPLECAVCRMFVKQARDGQVMQLEDLLWGFKTDFGGTFLVGLMTTIFIFLWGLLFIIPGIVKGYSYSMAYYIKSDHPEYDWRECIQTSRETMRGHKWALFVLDLSFIGWYIVGSLVLGVGALWVEAYHSAARAQFYDAIKSPVVM